MIGIDLAKIKETIIAELWKYTGLDVVDTDNPKRRPKYPYLSMKFISIDPQDNRGNHSTIADEKTIKSTKTYQPEFIISFQAYSDDPVGPINHITKVADYFRHGHRELPRDKDGLVTSTTTALEDAGVVIAKVMNSQDRSTLEVNNYQYRWGVDVRFRTTHSVIITEERIDEIEGTITINK